MNQLFSNKDLKNLILPLVFEQALAITVGMADTIMISSVGEVAVSGVSLVDMLNMLIFSVLSALSTGGAVVVSQSIGANRMDRARKSARQLLLTVVIISTVIAVLAIVFRQGLITLFFGSIETGVMKAALIYLLISAISYPFLGLYNSCAALYRSVGKSNVTFVVSIIGNVINVAGNAICILGLKMGVAGVAIPSLLSRAVMGIILYVMLHNPKQELYLEHGFLRVDWPTIKNILYIGIPSSIENGIFQLGRVLVVSIISSFGTVQIAANGVANSLDSVGCIVGQAMNLAMITVIGRCVGAGDQRQIRYYLKKLIIITYIATAAINVPLLAGLKPVLSIYGLGAETTDLAHTLVMIHNGMAMIFWPLAFVFPYMLRACNDVRYPMVVSILSMFIFRIGFSYLLGVNYEMGAVGVWIAMVLDWICRTIFFVVRYFRGGWKETMYRLQC